MNFRYVASPYTHPNLEVIEARYKITCYITGACQNRHTGNRDNTVLYSPIAHWHPIASMLEMPRNFEPWMDINECMIRQSKGLVKLEMPGHETSRGMLHEISFARGLGLAIQPIGWSEMKDLLGTNLAKERQLVENYRNLEVISA